MHSWSFAYNIVYIVSTAHKNVDLKTRRIFFFITPSSVLSFSLTQNVVFTVYLPFYEPEVKVLTIHIIRVLTVHIFNSNLHTIEALRSVAEAHTLILPKTKHDYIVHLWLLTSQSDCRSENNLTWKQTLSLSSELHSIGRKVSTNNYF